MATTKTTRKTGARTGASKKATKKTTTKKTSTRKKKATAVGGAEEDAAKAAAPARQGGGAYPAMVRVEREIGGRTLSLETGRMAKQADGAIVARYGDTMVLATAQAAAERDDIDFFPLTVDYREKAAAAGKFPGGFFKREGRPTTREILTCRIIDRSIRPMFADGFKRETQVLSQVLCTDKDNDSDILAAVACFAALAVSSIPNGKTLGCCRIGLIDGKLVINPTWSQLQSADNHLNLTISAHDEAVVMVEAGAAQLAEAVVLEALELGQKVCSEIAQMIDELVAAAGKPKIEVAAEVRDAELDAAIDAKFGKQLRAAPTLPGTKSERSAAKAEAKAAVMEAFPPPSGASDKDIARHKKYVAKVCEEQLKRGEREAILDGKRADGRDHETIRPLAIDVGVLPRVHGSSLFTRGETQALCIATLGTTDDAQFIDGIYPEERRRWLLHYNFPPFSVGEVKRFLAPGRREIGHGALAERALEAVLPSGTEFPYSLRVTSEILESNGSSSMATVCGATLALMDAGVPIKQPVAGIAMGLVVEGKKVAILSDILGSEDHCGDMDFKVAGTGKGITALQMDIKCEGLSRATLENALEQARQGRLHLLREMLSVLRQPRDSVSPNAPRLVTIQVPQDKIGAIIGPMGRVIRGLQEEFQTRISVGDTGAVEVAGTEAALVDACIARIREMTAEVEVGAVYKGRVTGIKEFGAFVEILPGQEGLCHVSELSNEFIRSVTDVVQIGDELEVKVIDIDDFGKVKLSRRALLPPGEGRPEGREERPRLERGPRGRPGERDDRGERGERPPRRDRDRDDRGRRGEREDRFSEAEGRERGGRDDRGRERGSREDRPRFRDRAERDDRPRQRERDDFEDRPRHRERDDRPARDDDGGRWSRGREDRWRGERPEPSHAGTPADDAAPDDRPGRDRGRSERGPRAGRREPREEREADRGPRGERDAPPWDRDRRDDQRRPRGGRRDERHGAGREDVRLPPRPGEAAPPGRDVAAEGHEPSGGFRDDRGADEPWAEEHGGRSGRRGRGRRPRRG